MWQIFLDIVGLVSNLAQTGIAGIGLWLGWKTFLRREEQDSISSNETNTGSEIRELKLFETSKQTTWLKVTDIGLECHLEDERPNRGGHQWTLSKQDVQSALANGDLYINPSHKIRTGLLSIGRYSNWLYSKKLFPEPAILHHRVVTLLRATV